MANERQPELENAPARNSRAQELLARTVTAYYGAIASTIAGRIPEAQQRHTELAMLMDEARRLLWPPVPWRELAGVVRDMRGGVAGEKEAREMLQGLRDRGRRPYYGWTEPIGLPHEDAARPETWGPRSASEVDWTGF